MSQLWTYFNCTRCGRCCEDDLPWDRSRIVEIAAFLGISVDELLNTYYGTVLPDGSLEFDDSKRTPCPFCKVENSISNCMIYPVRPEGCRLFPFESDCGDAGVGCPAAKITYEVIKKLQAP